MTAAFDLAICGGNIVDGTGSPQIRGDLGIRDGCVTAIGELSGKAATTLDATGLIVAPGFIDVHTHYDAQVFWDPMLSPSSFHGVTSVLAGNCGFSIAPLNGDPADSEYLMRMLSRVEGMPLESLREGVPWNWQGFGQYLSMLDRRVALNAGFMVGHSALRRAVMGRRAVGDPATSADVTAMQQLLRDSLRQGGMGFSTTTSRTHNDADGNPVPSRFATDDERFALAKVVGEFEGTWLEMVSDVGTKFSDASLHCMTEMSRAAGRALNWNLLSPDSRHVEIFEAQLAASDYAAARGARVIALAAPQPVKLIINLAAGMIFDAFPGWDEVMRLGLRERKQRLADPDCRRELNRCMLSPDAGMMRALGEWSEWTIVTAALPSNVSLNGTKIGTLASRLGKAPLDALLDLALEESLLTLFSPPVTGGDLASWRMRGNAWRDVRALIGGSDAGAHLDMIDTFAFSTQVLSVGVRDYGLLSMEDAVHRMTDLPAKAFGLRRRGRLQLGFCADVAVFDQKSVGRGPIHTRNDLPAGASRLYCDAIGMRHVVVNGQPIIVDGQATGALPGTVLRSGRDTFSVPATSNASVAIQ